MDEKGILGMAATRILGDKLIANAIKNTPDGGKWECPCCGHALPFQSLEWQGELPLLIARYAGEFGINPELSGMSLIELYGVYLHLIEYDGRL